MRVPTPPRQSVQLAPKPMRIDMTHPDLSYQAVRLERELRLRAADRHAMLIAAMPGEPSPRRLWMGRRRAVRDASAHAFEITAERMPCACLET
jgi:hypothetical protein